MRLFKDINGNKIDPVNHTLSIIKNFPSVKIHVGSDSQNVGKKTNYASVIAYRLGTRGVPSAGTAGGLGARYRQLGRQCPLLWRTTGCGAFAAGRGLAAHCH